MAERGRRHWSQVKLDEIVGIDLPDDERDLCGKGFINGVAQRGLPTRSLR